MGADLPISIALQYSENVSVENKFITLYQIESENAKNAGLELVFKMTHNGMIKMEKVQVMTKEEPKRRKTTEPTQESDKSEPVSNAVPCCELKFNKTSLGGMAQDMVNHYVNYEQQSMSTQRGSRRKKPSSKLRIILIKQKIGFMKKGKMPQNKLTKIF